MLELQDVTNPRPNLPRRRGFVAVRRTNLRCFLRSIGRVLWAGCPGQSSPKCIKRRGFQCWILMNANTDSLHCFWPYIPFHSRAIAIKTITLCHPILLYSWRIRVPILDCKYTPDIQICSTIKPRMILHSLKWHKRNIGHPFWRVIPTHSYSRTP